MTRITLLVATLAVTTLVACVKKPEFSEFMPEDTSIVVQSSGGTVIEQSGVSLPGQRKGHQGREVKLKLPDGRSLMLIRIFPAGDSYIQIAATFPVDPSYNQELYARRFVESVRLR